MQHEMQHENDTIFQALGVIRAPSTLLNGENLPGAFDGPEGENYLLIAFFRRTYQGALLLQL